MQALIFDLDNCLCPARAVGEHFFDPVFAAIRAAAPPEFDVRVLQDAFEACWIHPFDAVCERHGFTPAMRQAGFEGFARAEVQGPLVGYPDLHLLPRFPTPRFLVTSGFRRLQASRIRALGLDAHFDDIHIDAIDEAGRLGKRGVFERIIARGGWPASEVWVVGDNPDSELAAGAALGCVTVQTVRQGIMESPIAMYRVAGLEGLLELSATPR